MVYYLLLACALATTPCTREASWMKSKTVCMSARNMKPHPEQWECLPYIPTEFYQQFQLEKPAQ
jgi:hypothetical protein